MSCYYVASTEPRMVRGRHGEECAGEVPPIPPFAWVECRGCQPCTEPHCLLGWRDEDKAEGCKVHAESVCPWCLGKVREHLAEIVRLSGLPLVDEVLTRGAKSEASDLLGPTADPVQWRQRGNYGHIYHPDSRIGELHPLWVLGTWDLMVTEHLGHKRTQRAGIRSSAAYLELNLTYLAADMEFDFPVLAGELRSCREHLERVLSDGEQRETGAPCMKCGRKVVRLTGDDGKVTFRCTKCREDISDTGYLFTQKADRLRTAERLTADDMATRTGVPAGTIRRWANVRNIRGVDYDPLFRSPGRNGMGHKVYRVSDVVFVRDNGGDTRGSTQNADESGTVSNGKAPVCPDPEAAASHSDPAA